MRDRIPESPVALLALTEPGVRTALRLQTAMQGSVCYVPRRHRFALAMGSRGFARLKEVFPEVWGRHRRLVCVMATGIVVRLAAPLLDHKSRDPAVVVLDERGQYAVSLLSGHWGGANELARWVAELCGGRAVITTASDVQDKPAWDLAALRAGLEPESFDPLPRLARAVLEDEAVYLRDPENRLAPYLDSRLKLKLFDKEEVPAGISSGKEGAGVWVGEDFAPPGIQWLELRPRTLVVGIGCNRGTSAQEILELVESVFQEKRWSLKSIHHLASVDLKADEPGLREAAARLERPLLFYSRDSLKTVSVPNPSSIVLSHIGAPSVCEATALLSARSQALLIPKRKTLNATAAVARVASPS